MTRRTVFRFRTAAAVLTIMFTLTGCAGEPTDTRDQRDGAVPQTTSVLVTSATSHASTAPESNVPDATQAPSVATAVATPAPSSSPLTESQPSTAPTTTSTSATTGSTVIPGTTIRPTAAAAADEVEHVFPVVPTGSAGYQNDHSTYPATDIFLDCGATVVSPVDGVVDELRRNDPWDAAVDDPATRGGLFVSIIGDDGVRYYLAHFRKLDDRIDVGLRLAAGEVLGEMGDTGRSGACHTHFALSPPCTNDEWWVRRGVIGCCL